MRRMIQARLSDAHSVEATKKRGRRNDDPAQRPEASLILRNARVDLLAPGDDAALDVVYVLEAGVLQELDGPGAAAAGLAVDDEVLVLVQLRQTLRQFAQGHELHTDVGDFVLVRLSHVEHLDVLAVVQLALEVMDRDLRYAVLLCGRVRLGDAAEFLVVDELGDTRVLAADGAVRVLAELHLPKAHAQRIVEEEPSDERLADTED